MNQTVNMLQAKSTLSRIVENIASGRLTEVIIARNGKPAARIVPINQPVDVSKRIGIAKHLGEIPANFDESDEDIARLFNGKEFG